MRHVNYYHLKNAFENKSFDNHQHFRSLLLMRNKQKNIMNSNPQLQLFRFYKNVHSLTLNFTALLVLQQSVMLLKLALLCFLRYTVNGGSTTYTSSFNDIVKGSVQTNCAFDLSYTDSYFIKISVSCGRIWRWQMTVDYVHETKSMHILTLRIRISMSGRTRILSSSVEKSK